MRITNKKAAIAEWKNLKWYTDLIKSEVENFGIFLFAPAALDKKAIEVRGVHGWRKCTVFDVFLFGYLYLRETA